MSAMTELQTSNSGPDPTVQTFDARALVKKGVKSRIVLDEQTCYLRITRAGKLILTT